MKKKTSTGSTVINPDEVFTKSEPQVEVREIHHYHKDDKTFEKRITSAFTMIIIGIVLLLNTTGNLDWSVWWEFIKFWPMFIVSAGLQLMLSFSRPTKIIAEFLGLIIFAMLILFAAINTNSGIFKDSSIFTIKTNSILPFFSLMHTDNAVVTDEVSIKAADYPDVSGQVVLINQAVGESFLNIGTDNSDLFYATVFSPQNKDGLELSQKVDNENLVIGLESAHKNNWSWNMQSPVYKYHVSNALTVNKLGFELAAGKSTINLDKAIVIDKIITKTAAGEMIINIEDNAVPAVQELEVGAGNMVINLSENVGYQVDYEVGVGNASIAGMQNKAGFGENGTFTSSNWDSATTKTTIKIKVGVGNFKLVVK